MADYGTGRFYVHDRALREHRTFTWFDPRWWVVDSTTNLPVDELTTKRLAMSTAAAMNRDARAALELEQVKDSNARNRVSDVRDELIESGELDPDTLCAWFALCVNPAAGTVAHPVLGPVLCCERCAAKLDLELERPRKRKQVRA